MTLARMSAPAKALVTCILLTLAVGMLGALGQIIVHDIIPTFFSPASTSDAGSHGGGHHATMEPAAGAPAAGERGDLSPT